MNGSPRHREDILDDDGNEILKGHEAHSSGASDSSDSGSDSVGLGRDDDTSDRNGTGERGTVGDDIAANDGADISADRIVEARQAGLGSGLDQAEEAQLGITDEEIADLEEEDAD